MKNFAFLFLFLGSIYTVLGQCVVEPFSLQKRTYISDVVLEAQVVSQTCVWDKDRMNIYTIHKLRPINVLKGNLNNTSEVEMLTIGGRVGLDMLSVNPSLDVSRGEIGMFFLKNSTRVALMNELKGHEQVFDPSASVQSFVQYDPVTWKVYDYFQTFSGVGVLQKEIIGYAEQDMIRIESEPWLSKKIKSLAAPVILSWSADTVSAGTGTLLTITGSNFGIARGKGTVEFRDANFGDGRFYKPPYGSSYSLWTNSKIIIYVPSRAGSGDIRITNNGNETTTSFDDLHIPFSHINVDYWSASVDSAEFLVDVADDNNSGGYTFHMNHKFKAKSLAVNSFMRALETWRCNTLVNWDVGADTSVDIIGNDDVNIVRLTKFTDSKLGVCYSRHKGCFQNGVLHWVLSDVDIEFDSLRNWYYGTGKPGSSQIDFESVASHELGHGHQLGHVRDDKKLMHYSISNGTRKVNLHAEDLQGGSYVINKSKTSNPCGASAHVPIQKNNCNITKPKALFTLSDTVICPESELTITNKSEGIVKTFSWEFGSDASKSSASNVGPHILDYSTRGSKTIQLIVGNDFGFDTLSKSLVVLPPPPIAPNAFIFSDSICTGKQVYRIAPIVDASEYLWEVLSGGNINGTEKDTIAEVDWTLAGGPYSLTVRAINSCGESDSIEAMIYVTQRATSSFTQSAVGRDLSFTFTGSGAETFSWNFGDGKTSSESNPVHEYSTAGKYNVTLVVANHCSTDTFSGEVLVSFGVGIGNLRTSKVKIYPNPVQEYLTINNAGNELISYALFSADGKMIQSGAVAEQSQTRLNIRNLSAGVYVMEVIENNSKYHHQIIKE